VCSAVLVAAGFCGCAGEERQKETPDDGVGGADSGGTPGAGRASAGGLASPGSGGAAPSAGGAAPSSGGKSGKSGTGGGDASGGNNTGGNNAGGNNAGGSNSAGGNSGSGGGASNAGGNAGTASGGHGGSSKPPYDAHRDPNAPGILIHVENDCPFDLWIHGAGKGAVLDPDNKRLGTGESQDYTAPDEWSAARVTAYGAAPDAQGRPQQEFDKVEMTLGKKIINYNITYVDWLGLPVEMLALGSGADCKSVGCYIPVDDVSKRCPDGLLSGKKCRSAGSYCADGGNQSSAFCHALDAQIAKCAGDAQHYPECGGAAGATTGQVYGCAGFFGGSPKWCAALNRGMLDAPDNGTISEYYTHPPFNTYSQWVHSVCPGIYAFPYDDYGKTNESGFHACGGGRQLNITFCPSG
jgi:hypothetical protein